MIDMDLDIIYNEDRFAVSGDLAMDILFIKNDDRFKKHYKFIAGLQKEIDACGHNSLLLSYLIFDLQKRYKFTWQMVGFPRSIRACSVYEGAKVGLDRGFTKKVFDDMQLDFCRILNRVIGILFGE